jgi:hypothetical protein
MESLQKLIARMNLDKILHLVHIGRKVTDLRYLTILFTNATGKILEEQALPF